VAPSLKIDLLSHSNIREGFVEFDHSSLDGCEHIGHDEDVEKMLKDERDVEQCGS
jgi:hypothetical protein